MHGDAIVIRKEEERNLGGERKRRKRRKRKTRKICVDEKKGS